MSVIRKNHPFPHEDHFPYLDPLFWVNFPKVLLHLDLQSQNAEKSLGEPHKSTTQGNWADSVLTGPAA